MSGSVINNNPYARSYRTKCGEPFPSLESEQTALVKKVKDQTSHISFTEESDESKTSHPWLKRGRSIEVNDNLEIPAKKVCIRRPEGPVFDRIVNPDFRHQLPIVSQKVAGILDSLDHMRKNAPKLKKEHNQLLSIAIKKTTATGLYPGLRLCKVNDQIGMGVFLAPDAPPIEKGEILGIYSGEYVIHQLTKVKREQLNYAFALWDVIALEKKEHQSVFRSMKSFEENGDYCAYTDAKKKGNWTRFMNDGGKDANCIPEVVRYTYHDGTKERTLIIVIVSVLKTINPGEQLLLNYGKEYWEQDSGSFYVTPSTFMLR